MNMKKTLALLIGFYFAIALPDVSNAAPALDGNKLVKAAVDYWRDRSSYSESKMTIHRPRWEREMSVKVWTEGDDNALVRFTAPAKDAGNASLTRGNQMWLFTPNINKIVRVPPSMMHQSWMGSDFSYNDLAKADDIIEHYDHKIVATTRLDDKIVYTVESHPHESAPVVWGKEILLIREDFIILEHAFYDQDGRLTKKLRAAEIKPLDGKLYATVIVMEQIEKADTWTRIETSTARFGVEIPDVFFTLSNLRHPRQ